MYIRINHAHTTDNLLVYTQTSNTCTTYTNKIRNETRTIDTNTKANMYTTYANNHNKYKPFARTTENLLICKFKANLERAHTSNKYIQNVYNSTKTKTTYVTNHKQPINSQQTT